MNEREECRKKERDTEEREGCRERERDGRDVAIVVLKLVMHLPFHFAIFVTLGSP